MVWEFSKSVAATKCYENIFRRGINSSFKTLVWTFFAEVV